MRYPKLIRAQDCRTPCTVVLYGEGISEDGAPAAVYTADLTCLFQSSARRIRTAEQTEVTLSGEVFFPWDFCPELPEIPDGEITVLGVKRHIVSGMKARNPDGSVNYIRLEVV